MRKAIYLTVIAYILKVSISFALSTDTHQFINTQITTKIMNGFSLDLYLKEQLNLPDGVTMQLSSSISGDTFQIFDWLRIGGLYEDKPPWVAPYLRSANHFHDPITDKGFTGLPPGDSAIVWSQKPIDQQWIGGHYSWLDSRDNFYMALTSVNKTVREEKLAETFRGVGQLMHLIQDMSVPEHARNDYHALPAYEEWLADNNSIAADILSYSSSNPTYPDSILLLNVSPFSNAIVPIANLFDTNQYTGSSAAGTTSATFGLSEYTSANFFSPDTIFDSSYPYPGWSGVQEYDEIIDPITGKKRTYMRKTADGELIEHLATSRWFYKYLPAELKSSGLKLDDKVYADYAQKLVPRAVGYSAALLDYFFRGIIELSLPAQGVYATAAPDGTFTEIRVNAKNTTATGEEMSNGTFQLVVKYNLSLDDPFQSILVDLGPDTYISVPEKNSVAAISRTIPTELVFELSTSPIPLWAANISIQVVFKGKLGNEIDAVAVGYGDISEPTPVDVYNNTDYTCLNSTWYRYDDPAAMAIVDSNADGIADKSDIYPHTITNISFLGGPADVGTLNAATSNNLFAAGPLQPGQILRMGYILTDYANRYAIYEIRTGLNGDPFSHIPVNENFSGTGFLNDWNTQDLMYSFRGQNMWWGGGVIFINTEYNGTCTFDALNQLLGY